MNLLRQHQAAYLLPFFLGPLVGAGVSLGAAEPRYHVITRYSIGGEDDYGHLRLDPEARRLFVPHGARVEVLDVDSGKKIGEITPTQGARGVALAPEFNHGFISNALDSSVTMFDLQTLQVLKAIKSGGARPGAIEYDADTKRVFVCNDASGDVAVIDAGTGAVTANVALGGKLRQLAANGFGRLFVTAEDRNVIHVVDTHTLRSMGDFSMAFSLALGEQPVGLALDRVGRRVFVACRNKRLLVLDADIGFPMPGTNLGIGGDPGDVAFDTTSRRTFLANNDGTLTVIQQQTNAEGSFMSYAVVQDVPTQNGARTLAIDEKTHRVFLCAGREVLVVGE